MPWYVLARWRTSFASTGPPCGRESSWMLWVILGCDMHSGVFGAVTECSLRSGTSFKRFLAR